MDLNTLELVEIFLVIIDILILFLSASYFVSSFEFCGIFGSIFSGVITDFIHHYKRRSTTTTTNKKTNQSVVTSTPIKARFYLVCIYIVILIGCMHLFNFHVKVKVSDLLLYSIASVAGALCYGCIALLGVIAMEFTTDEFSGTSHAIAALFANIGAVLAGLPFSLVSRYYSWNFGFKLVQVFGALVLMVLIVFRNSKKFFVPITPERKRQ